MILIAQSTCILHCQPDLLNVRKQTMIPTLSDTGIDYSQVQSPICLNFIWLYFINKLPYIWQICVVAKSHYFILCTHIWTNWKIKMFIIDNNAQAVKKEYNEKRKEKSIPIWEEETILSNFIIYIYKTSFVAAIKEGTKIKLTDRTSYEVILHIWNVRCGIRQIIFHLHWYIRYNDIKI